MILRCAHKLWVMLLISLAGCSLGGPQTPELAPDFTLRVFQSSENLTLSQVYAEHPVLLVFWASWCPACIEEIPLLNQWQKDYQEQGLRIIGVNVQETEETVAKFKKKNTIGYPIVMDKNADVTTRYGVMALPVSVFLEKGGKINYYGFGLPAHLDQMLAQDSSPESRKEIGA